MPNSLQGLNIVYPAPPPSDNPSKDLLTPPPGFPDLTAQLDLWTHLSFASDEPFIDTERKEQNTNPLDLQDPKLTNPNEMKHETTHQSLIANTDKPIQTAIDTDTTSPDHPPSALPNATSGSFDLGSFLAGFGIDPFLVPPLSSIPPPASSTISSLSSLENPSSSSSDTSLSAFPTAADSPTPSKRARTRKTSVSQTHAIAPSSLQQPIATVARAVSELSDDHDPLSTPLTAAEDKRRRNTAASARFRAKKKEREQALERRSKELETRVNELERECEGLRRENGWLKGLVVGVTGSNPSDVPKAPVDDEVTGNEFSKKRKRDADGGTLIG